MYLKASQFPQNITQEEMDFSRKHDDKVRYQEGLLAPEFAKGV